MLAYVCVCVVLTLYFSLVSMAILRVEKIQESKQVEKVREKERKKRSLVTHSDRLCVYAKLSLAH